MFVFVLTIQYGSIIVEIGYVLSKNGPYKERTRIVPPNSAMLGNLLFYIPIITVGSISVIGLVYHLVRLMVDKWFEGFGFFSE